MTELTDQIKVVVEARTKAKGLVDKKKALYDEFIAGYTDFFGDVVVAQTKVGEAEDKLRELTLQAYQQTGNKAPAPGVGIREVTQLNYDAKTAYDWALEHKMAIKLDVSAFEKIAKASPPDFVAIHQEPQATISPNLES